MKKHVLILFIGINTCIILVSCLKKDTSIFNPNTNNGLPELSSEGKNTFGCLVNGEVWIPEGYKSMFRAEYYPWHDAGILYGSLALKAYDHRNNAGLTVNLYNRVFTTGRFLVYNDKHAKNQLFYSINGPEKVYINYNLDSANYIEISRLDTISRIVSGTINFKLINENDVNDTIKITEGRFDLHF